MKFPFVLAIAFLAPLSAQAQLTPDRLAQDFAAAGYSRVEIRQGPTQMKVEAWNASHKIEAVYDTASGALLKTETEMLAGLGTPAAGVSVRARARDFVEGLFQARAGDDKGGRGRGNDDGAGDDRGRGRGKGTDDTGADDRGGKGARGRGNDDGAGDDRGRGRGKGTDDTGADDRGGKGRGRDDGAGDDNGGRGRGTDD